MKFGGTSVADTDRIRVVAKKVQAEVDNGYVVCVVVSAMSGVTNDLIKNCDDLGLSDSDPEYSNVVSAGEIVTSGLLAGLLQGLGVRARSWRGDQVPIMCDSSYGRSRILDIPSEGFKDLIDAGEVAVVAGFQGVTSSGRITTLGRGGSDTTAVALAATLKAHRCDIYTDVDGVYTADPRIVKNAKKIKTARFSEVLEMAGLGTKVLHARCVELAMKENIPLQVLSSMENHVGSDLKGTMIMKDNTGLEGAVVTGVSHSLNDAQVTVHSVKDVFGELASITRAMSNEDINLDMISQPRAKDGETSVTFTLPKGDADNAVKILSKIDFNDVSVDRDVAKISAVGAGMVSNSGVAAAFFGALADERINVRVVTTSDIKISALVDESKCDRRLTPCIMHFNWAEDVKVRARAF